MEVSCFPWLARLLAGDMDAAVHGLSHGTPDVAELTRFATAHQLGPLLFRRTDHPALQAMLPNSLRQKWQETYVRQWLAGEKLIGQLHRLQQAFSNSGKEFVLLKGPCLAQGFYGDLAQRKYEDIDLLVPARLARPTLRWLNKEFKFPGGGLFHPLLARLTHAKSGMMGDLGVDLHWALRVHPSFSIDEARVWKTRQPFNLPGAGCAVNVMSNEYALVLTLLEIFDDISRLEYSAKGFIDAFLILHTIDSTMNWPGFFARRKTERLHRIVFDVLTMIVELFNARDVLPALTANLAQQGPAESRSLKIMLAPASRLNGLWSYRLSLYDMPRPISALHLLISGPLRTLLM